MTRSRLQLVCDKHVHELTGPVDSPTPIVVGTDAWYTLLMDQQIQSFSFRHHLGTFTIRRERKRHGLYWYAYHKLAGRLRKAYLGKSEELTLERLNAVADALIGQGKNDDGKQVHPDEPDRSALLLSPETANGNGLSYQTSAFTYPTEQGQTLKYNLPARLTPMIGREKDVAAVCAFLRQPDVRLLTLTGAGGVGKTCLGLQIATDLLKDFADGVCFVSLAPISDPDLVMPAIAQTLGIKEPGDQPYRELLAAYLVEKHLLLFLDNFEQVIDTAPALIELLGRCPSLKILVTSREVLRVRAEQEFPVLPLALPNLSHLPEPECVSQYAAVALFLQRARCYRPDFQLTAANARTIAAICVHLDGLPLALELAAARLKLLSPQALLARLANRLQVLTQGPRDVHLRHQTLRNTLQWSYDLLDTQEQRLFRRLAVFVSGCTLEAVEAVCKASGDEMMNVFDRAASLLDKNLVQQQRGQRDEEPRLLMLETIREYGLESLAMSGELELTRRVHADYYLALAEEVGSSLGDPQPAVWLERLEQEHDNLRAAMWWSLERGEGGQDIVDRREMALRFGVALRGFWVVHGYWSEGRTFLERALSASEATATAVRAKVLEAAASLAIYQIDHDRGEVLFRESLEQCREYGDTAGTANSLYMLGTIARQRGDFAEARLLMEESLSLSKEANDKYFIAHILSDLGGMATQQGEYAKAYSLFEESRAMSRKLGDAISIASSLLAFALMLFVSLGDLATVRSMLEESLTISKELGHKGIIARCLSHSGLVTLQQGDTAAAHRLSEESLALHRETGDQWGISWVLSILAKVKAREGDQRAAFTLYQESLAIARKIGSKLNIAVCLEGMASVLATQGEPVRAAQLWGAAEALRETMGAPIWPVERATYERTVAAARSLIGRKVFVAAWAEGRTIPLEYVLVDRKNTRTPQQALTSPHTIAVLSRSSDAGLTSREIDVLSLLAQGLTSAQIAKHLMISLVTVNTHVRSIYTKLGVTSRSSATRYAVEHHLV
jgi:predicted ATPase/DNA-binding CsgD family transcriptional regulator/tetratricopeptide (TPR) repeat protein